WCRRMTECGSRWRGRARTSEQREALSRLAGQMGLALFNQHLRLGRKRTQILGTLPVGGPLVVACCEPAQHVALGGLLQELFDLFAEILCAGSLREPSAHQRSYLSR